MTNLLTLNFRKENRIINYTLKTQSFIIPQNSIPLHFKNTTLNTTKIITGFHPKNKHHGKYDFKTLIVANPDLAPFVAINEFGTETIDFANPDAVKMLNKALLLQYYGLKNWDIPKGFLCPPIPGRAEYIHQVADILENMYGTLQTKHKIRILDVGIGANCIYPIIGVAEYDWRFVGSEVDKQAFEAA